MKNLLCLLLVLPFILGCDPEENQNDINLLSTDNWRLKCTINGVTQESEGNGPSTNCVSTGITQNGWLVQGGVSDPSSATYISGPIGTLAIFFPQVYEGVCEGKIYTNGSFSSLLSQAITDAGGITDYVSDIQGEEATEVSLVTPPLPFLVTDLGTAGDGFYNGGTSFKASYSGTIYAAVSFSQPSCTIPIDISLEFEALRQ